MVPGCVAGTLRHLDRDVHDDLLAPVRDGHTGQDRLRCGALAVRGDHHQPPRTQLAKRIPQVLRGRGGGEPDTLGQGLVIESHGRQPLPRIGVSAVRSAVSGSCGNDVVRQAMCLSGRTSSTPPSSTSRNLAQS